MTLDIGVYLLNSLEHLIHKSLNLTLHNSHCCLILILAYHGDIMSEYVVLLYYYQNGVFMYSDRVRSVYIGPRSVKVLPAGMFHTNLLPIW